MFKKVSVRLCLPLLVSFLLFGCALPYPHQRALSPVFQGAVVDADSGQPISNVRIEVVGGYPTRSVIGKTNDMGVYELGVTEDATWFTIRPLLSEGVCSGKVSFSHSGYETKFFNQAWFGSSVLDGPCGNVKLDVHLQKIAANASK